jgi:hypothetical protein
MHARPQAALAAVFSAVVVFSAVTFRDHRYACENTDSVSDGSSPSNPIDAITVLGRTGVSLAVCHGFSLQRSEKGQNSEENDSESSEEEDSESSQSNDASPKTPETPEIREVENNKSPEDSPKDSERSVNNGSPGNNMPESSIPETSMPERAVVPVQINSGGNAVQTRYSGQSNKMSNTTFWKDVMFAKKPFTHLFREDVLQYLGIKDIAQVCAGNRVAHDVIFGTNRNSNQMNQLNLLKYLQVHNVVGKGNNVCTNSENRNNGRKGSGEDKEDKEERRKVLSQEEEEEEQEVLSDVDSTLDLHERNVGYYDGSSNFRLRHSPPSDVRGFVHPFFSEFAGTRTSQEVYGELDPNAVVRIRSLCLRPQVRGGITTKGVITTKGRNITSNLLLRVTAVTRDAPVVDDSRAVDPCADKDGVQGAVADKDDSFPYTFAEIERLCNPRGGRMIGGRTDAPSVYGAVDQTEQMDLHTILLLYAKKLQREGRMFGFDGASAGPLTELAKSDSKSAEKVEKNEKEGQVN